MYRRIKAKEAPRQQKVYIAIVMDILGLRPSRVARIFGPLLSKKYNTKTTKLNDSVSSHRIRHAGGNQSIGGAGRAEPQSFPWLPSPPNPHKSDEKVYENYPTTVYSIGTQDRNWDCSSSGCGIA